MGYLGEGHSKFNTANDLKVDGDANVTGSVDATSYTGDGSSLTGINTDLVSDTTPSLGGDLSTNGNDVNFSDNDKAQFGASNDLQIYHDGSNSYIDDSGTGNLKIRGANVNIEKYTGETMAEFIADGETNLRYNHALKLKTTSTGVDVTGTVNSQAGATYGNLAMPVLEITSNSTPTQIKITTNIPFSGYAKAETIHIKGFVYGLQKMCDLLIGFHVYNNSFTNRTASSGGGWSPKVQLAVENDKVVIHLANPGYWPKLYVHSHYSTYGAQSNSTGWSWANAAISGDSGKPVETVLYKQTTGSEGSNAEIDLRQGSSKVWSAHETIGTVSTYDSYNQTSLTDLGVGRARVTINNNMDNGNYAISGGTSYGYTTYSQFQFDNQDAGQLESYNSPDYNKNFADGIMHLAVHGDLA